MLLLPLQETVRKNSRNQTFVEFIFKNNFDNISEKMGKLDDPDCVMLLYIDTIGRNISDFTHTGTSLHCVKNPSADDAKDARQVVRVVQIEVVQAVQIEDNGGESSFTCFYIRL